MAECPTEIPLAVETKEVKNPSFNSLFLWTLVLTWQIFVNTQATFGQDTTARPVAIDESALTLFSRDLQLSAAAPGLLMTMEINEGDVVEQDQVLASLDQRESKLRLELATLRHNAAIQKRDSTVELRLASEAVTVANQAKKRTDGLEANVASQTERDQVNFEYQRAVLTEEQAKENQILNSIEVDVLASEVRVADLLLDIQSIKAPLGGVVVAIFKRPGEYVQPGEPVIRLVKNDVMRVSALVSLEQSEFIQRDAPVRFIVKPDKQHASERTFLGKVIAVSPENQRENNSSVPVLAEIQNAERTLKANVTGTLEIYIPEQTASSVDSGSSK